MRGITAMSPGPESGFARGGARCARHTAAPRVASVAALARAGGPGGSAQGTSAHLDSQLFGHKPTGPRGFTEFDDVPEHLKKAPDWQLEEWARNPDFPLSPRAQQLHDALTRLGEEYDSAAHFQWSRYPPCRY